MGLIEDAVHAIGIEVSKVQSRSEELLKIYNLNNEIKDLEEKKTTILLEIGNSVYCKYKEQKNLTEESQNEKCAEIVLLEQDIAKLKTQLAALKIKSKTRQ